MADQFEHLQLPFIPEELLRKKRKGGRGPFYKKTERDKEIFYKTEMQNFFELKKNFQVQKRKFQEFFNPKLIYKISINQLVDENDLREQLKKYDIEVISPSPDKKGFWVVFSDDEQLKKIENELKKYPEQERKYGYFIDAIEDIVDIPPEEKIGPMLKEQPFGVNEVTSLDFSIWRMDDKSLSTFLEGLKKFVRANSGIVVDEFRTKNFCRQKIRVNHSLLNEIITLKEIESVDRPPKIRLLEKIEADIRDFLPDGKPADDAPGILIVDSGILPNQPLLKDSVGHAIAIATKDHSRVRESDPYDDVGHGTQVAGIALYGDIQDCIDKNKFSPEFWIFSSKVMYKDQYGQSTYDMDELFEHQLYSAVTRIITDYPQCKIVNLSLGCSEYRMFSGKRQFDIASLIDELAKEFKIIFVISAGNYFDWDTHNDYPEYLLDESSDRCKIIDTASAALGITVGALYYEIIPGPLVPRYVIQPSRYSRVGLGYRGMIKPDLVEIGGGTDDSSHIITINPFWIDEHRLFCLDYGTSFSAPKISHYFAKIIQKYPNASHNLIKALLLSSASIPIEKPGSLNSLSIYDAVERQKNLLKIYGNGKPDITKALYSEKNRVLLIKENTIKPKHIQIYPFSLPESFIEIKGTRSISVSLAFDPPVNKNRVEYLGVAFEMHLFKNVDPISIKQAYSQTDLENNDEELVPESLKTRQIKLYPSPNLRKKGTLQKGTQTFYVRPKIDTKIPLTLVIICQNRWEDENYEQEYSVVVTVEHSQNIDIYNQIRIKNRERAEIIL